MQIRSFLMGAVSSVFLTGCTSLNVHQTNVYIEDSHAKLNQRIEQAAVTLPPVPLKPAVSASSAPPPLVPNCPVFVPPLLKPIPVLPYKELEAAGNNAAQIEEVKRRHIEELRAFIVQQRQDLQRAYQHYASECKMAKHH